MARTYNQDCILAHALDLLGERWTLLIIRDLFLGPQRFGDLQAGLPGIGANLLSKRLKELEEAGLITTAGAAGETKGRYRLTETGEGLRPTVRTLMKWSIMYFMDRPEVSSAHECIYSNDLQPDSVALAIEIFAAYCPEASLNYVARIIIDDFPYTIYNMNGQLICRRGADAPAVATLQSDVATIMQAFRMELTLDEAKSRMKLNGDKNALNHLLRCIVHAEWDADSHEARMLEAVV
ncbi:helix-turn-helix domain-containing protein [Hyphococcus flavus]|uniref:Helix-turn-helix domain-containing protein n=1 Tax=Hyphococcus flavus TaxID=1866326 RepID=A0AAE9ZG42_9PROT|nr:helix-turn-helix domain-containing protein [Hyphococcus flavus]WDI32117.1 helix-turn-helix domain-containing protein [Hyphococcus flavus]